jgi:hypothetical protein
MDLKRERAAETALYITLKRKLNGFFFLYAIFLFKSFNATCGIDKFLFSGEEWMTIRTKFYLDTANCRTCYKCISTNTCHFASLIIWMNSLFHFKTTSLIILGTNLGMPELKNKPDLPGLRHFLSFFK